MSISIIKKNHNTYLVNNKEVIEDFDGRIYSRFELTISEEKALLQYINSANKIRNNQNTDDQ